MTKLLYVGDIFKWQHGHIYCKHCIVSLNDQSINGLQLAYHMPCDMSCDIFEWSIN